VVLGVQWLQTLKRFVLDYTIPLLEFTHNIKTITLTGITHNTPTPASFSQFCRFIFTDSIQSAHTITLHQLDANPTPHPCTPLPSQP